VLNETKKTKLQNKNAYYFFCIISQRWPN